MSNVPCIVSVEDDQDLFEIIRLTLASLPIQLRHAKTGQEAIELLRHYQADLLILDIMLPDINGWNVLKEIHTWERQPTSVIVLTAQTSATHRVIAHLQDVTAYMTKPFMPKELREKVVEILGLPVST
ncbi:MAG: response regulator [Ardenticatenaceae bacterium]|nr:response regulator [Anaerolineales bacterium]MCB8923699.1 response regulator [Ardenticatenaceae bacterium]